jgi:hypothetical protein
MNMEEWWIWLRTPPRYRKERYEFSRNTNSCIQRFRRSISFPSAHYMSFLAELRPSLTGNSLENSASLDLASKLQEIAINL